MTKEECLKAIILLSMRGYAYPSVTKAGRKYRFTMDKGGMQRFFADGEAVDTAIRDSFPTADEYNKWIEKKGVLL